MDKELILSIIFGLMGISVGFVIIITAYSYSLVSKPIDEDLIGGLIATFLLLSASILILNDYLRSS